MPAVGLACAATLWEIASTSKVDVSSSGSWLRVSGASNMGPVTPAAVSASVVDAGGSCTCARIGDNLGGCTLATGRGTDGAATGTTGATGSGPGGGNTVGSDSSAPAALACSYSSESVWRSGFAPSTRSMSIASSSARDFSGLSGRPKSCRKPPFAPAGAPRGGITGRWEMRVTSAPDSDVSTGCTTGGGGR